MSTPTLPPPADPPFLTTFVESSFSASSCFRFKEEYNPNFNDEGVKAAVKAYEDYAAREDDLQEKMPDSEVQEILKEDSETSGVNWKQFEGVEGSDTDVCESCTLRPPQKGFC